MPMPERRRILQVVFDFQLEGPGGGVTRFAIELCRHLDPVLFEVVLCGLWNAGTSLETEHVNSLKAEGIPTFTAAPWQPDHPYRSFYDAFRFLSSHLKDNPFDLIHSHSEFGDIAALGLKMLRRVPRIARTVHYGYQVEWRRRPLRRALLTNFLYPIYFDQEIGVSPAVTEMLNQRPLAGRLHRQALYLNNAVDLTRFQTAPAEKNALRQSLQLPVNRTIIGSVGRLTEQKGYTLFIQAAAQVVKSRPDVYFVILGDGEQRAEIETAIHELGLENHIILPGSRKNVEAYLYAYDLFVSSSRWEGLPTVVMESMAAGVPVVATNIPGSRDLVQDGVTGWLVKPENSGALAEKILLALDSPAEQERFTTQALKAIQIYSIENVAAAYAALYQKLLSK